MFLPQRPQLAIMFAGSEILGGAWRTLLLCPTDLSVLPQPRQPPSEAAVTVLETTNER